MKSETLTRFPGRNAELTLHNSGSEMVGQLFDHPTKKDKQIVVCSQSIITGTNTGWKENLFAQNRYTSGIITSDNRIYWATAGNIGHEDFYQMLFPEAKSIPDFVHLYASAQDDVSPPTINLVSQKDELKPTLLYGIEYFQRSLEERAEDVMCGIEYPSLLGGSSFIPARKLSELDRDIFTPNDY